MLDATHNPAARAEIWFSELQAIDNVAGVYHWLGCKLVELDDHLLCIGVRNDPVLDKGIVVAFHGLDRHHFASLVKLLGVNPIGKVYGKTPEAREYFFSDKRLREFDGNLVRFSGGQIPAWIAHTIEWLFAIRKVYTIALQHENLEMGTLLLFQRGTVREIPAWQIEKMADLASFRIHALLPCSPSGNSRRATFEQSLIANLNHEIRTPLNGILGLIGEVLEQRPDAADSGEMIEDVQNCAKDLQRTVDNLILISSLESRQVEWNPEEMTVEQVTVLVRSWLDDLDERSANRVMLESHIPAAQSGRLCIDWHLFAHVLNELVHNALKFSEASVEVRVEVRDRAMWLVVCDRGIGMAASEQREVFRTFHRSEHVRNSRGGNGVGLSIVDHIVRLHGFEVILHSHEGEGTVVEVRMPLESLHALS